MTFQRQLGMMTFQRQLGMMTFQRQLGMMTFQRQLGMMTFQRQLVETVLYILLVVCIGDILENIFPDWPSIISPSKQPCDGVAVGRRVLQKNSLCLNGEKKDVQLHELMPQFYCARACLFHNGGRFTGDSNSTVSGYAEAKT